jgi:nitroreductase
MYRRSYRWFLNKPVPGEILDNLLNAARYIPSGGNDHRFEITVITSEKKRAQLLEAIYSYYQKIYKLLNNPLLMQVAKRIGDPKVKATLNDPFNYKKIMNVISQLREKKDVVFYHAPAIFIFHTDRIMPTAMEDCILAAYNVSLLSETLGLGSCFVSLSQQAITNDKKCKEILSIPSSHRVHAVVIAGYPERIYERPAIRKPQHVTFVGS